MARSGNHGKRGSSIGLRPVGRVRATPLRSFYDRYALFGFVAISAGLLLFGRADTILVDASRRTVTEIATPLLGILREPVTAAEDFGDSVRGLADVYEENKRLKAELERLRGWEGVATTLSDENRLMRDLLSMSDELPPSVRSARMVADTSTPYVRAAVINAGSDDGIEKGQAVMNHLGLVGRIEGTASGAARVLMITDINSRLPVRFADDRVKGLAAGTNRALLRINYLPETAQPKIGERIVTSGDGGLIPAGLPVGVVELIDEDGTVFVRPYVDFTRLDYVRVLGMPIQQTVESKGGLPRGVANPEAEAVSIPPKAPIDILVSDEEAATVLVERPTRPNLRSLKGEP